MKNILETDTVAIARRLKQRREEKGITLLQAAKIAGIHPDVLHDIENGKSVLSPQMLMKFTEAYGCHMCDIVADMPVYTTEEQILDDYIAGVIGEGYAAHRLGDIGIVDLRGRALEHDAVGYWRMRWGM